MTALSSSIPVPVSVQVKGFEETLNEENCKADSIQLSVILLSETFGYLIKLLMMNNEPVKFTITFLQRV